MAIYARDASTTRKLKSINVHNGTTWRKLKEVWTHDGTAWKKLLVSFLPSRMTKSGSWTHPGNGSWSPITGWAADTAGYPGSSVSGNGLVIQSAATDAVIEASIPWSTNIGNGVGVQVRVKVNGTVVGTGTASPSGGSGTATVTVTGQTVPAGGIIVPELVCLQSGNAAQVSSGYVLIRRP